MLVLFFLSSNALKLTAQMNVLPWPVAVELLETPGQQQTAINKAALRGQPCWTVQISCEIIPSCLMQVIHFLFCPSAPGSYESGPALLIIAVAMCCVQILCLLTSH